MDKNEYVGRPLNVACRLQSSLSAVESTNKVLVTNGIKERLADPNLKLACYRTMRKLRNLDNTEMPYFEFDPFAFDADRRKKQSRELIKKLFEYKLKTDKDFARRVREINQNSSQTSSKEFYSRIQKLLESTLQKK
jgi:hypothetical protein